MNTDIYIYIVEIIIITQCPVCKKKNGEVFEICRLVIFYICDSFNIQLCSCFPFEMQGWHGWLVGWQQTWVPMGTGVSEIALMLIFIVRILFFTFNCLLSSSGVNVKNIIVESFWNVIMKKRWRNKKWWKRMFKNKSNNAHFLYWRIIRNEKLTLLRPCWCEKHFMHHRFHHIDMKMTFIAKFRTFARFNVACSRLVHWIYDRLCHMTLISE